MYTYEAHAELYVHLHSPRFVLQLVVHHPCLHSDSIEPVSCESELAILARECSLHRMQLKCPRSLDSLWEVSLDEVAPHISWRRGSHGFVPREPAEEKAVLLRAAVAVSYTRSPHGHTELAPVPCKQDVTTNCRSGTSLSHPPCHDTSDCHSHNQILIMRAKHFFRGASPTDGHLLQISWELN